RSILRLACTCMLTTILAKFFGLFVTVKCRLPFVVAPNPDPSGIDVVFMYTAAALSPGVSMRELVFSLVALTSIYAILLVVEVRLLTKFVRGGVVSAMPELAESKVDPETGKPVAAEVDERKDDVLAFAY